MALARFGISSEESCLVMIQSHLWLVGCLIVECGYWRGVRVAAGGYGGLCAIMLRHGGQTPRLRPRSFRTQHGRPARHRLFVILARRRRQADLVTDFGPGGAIAGWLCIYHGGMLWFLLLYGLVSLAGWWAGSVKHSGGACEQMRRLD